MGGVDGDAPGLLFGRVVNFLVLLDGGPAHGAEDKGNGRGQGGFTVVHVSDGTDINVGFGAFELLLCH